jgi:hypothetical protein
MLGGGGVWHLPLEECGGHKLWLVAMPTVERRHPRIAKGFLVFQGNRMATC